MRRTLGSALAGVIVSAACAGAGSVSGQLEPSAATALNRTEEVQTTLLRYMIDEGGDTVSAGPLTVACVDIAAPDGRTNTDSGPAILARFAGHDPPILPASECEITGDPLMEYARHRRTREAAIIYTLSTVDFILPDRAEASVSYYEASMSAAGWICRLRKGEEGWFVDVCEVQWMA